MQNSKSIEALARECLTDLGVDPIRFESRNLPLFEDAQQLVVADVSRSGREHLLTPEAARTWANMKHSAHSDGVLLLIVSAFRSFERQADLLRSKLEQGGDIETLFLANAPPGYSEHHTGRAIDIGTPDCAALSAEFATTPAFDWLYSNAERFGFRLTYPEANAAGFCFEPWHWCYGVNDS